MTVHTSHDSGILNDYCPRCQEQAENPLTTLDDVKLEILWQKMLQVEKTSGVYDSVSEAIACRKLDQFRAAINRLDGLRLIKVDYDSSLL